MSDLQYRRPIFGTLTGRLAEQATRIQVVSGPRQVGKTTVARQALESAALTDPAIGDA
jgi:predicted AAA+ superfamily ATPase